MNETNRMDVFTTLGREFCSEFQSIDGDLCHQDALEVFSEALSSEPTIAKLQDLNDGDFERLAVVCGRYLEHAAIESKHMRRVVQRTLDHWEIDKSSH